jgi:purine-nucleoside phosphorylase
VDAANGIGAIALKRLADKIGSNALSIQIINDAVTNADKLNKDVSISAFRKLIWIVWG